MLAMLDGDLVAGAVEPQSALLEMARLSTDDAELVTIYTGTEFDDSNTDEVLTAVQALAGEAEVEIVSGGQPHYIFLVAFE